jgi:hypothetical protein
MPVPSQAFTMIQCAILPTMRIMSSGSDAFGSTVIPSANGQVLLEAPRMKTAGLASNGATSTFEKCNSRNAGDLRKLNNAGLDHKLSR